MEHARQRLHNRWDASEVRYPQEDPYGSLTLFLRDTLRQHQFGVRKMLDGVTALDDAKVAYGRFEASKGCQKAKVAISPHVRRGSEPRVDI